MSGSRAVSGAGTLHVRDSPSPGVSLSLSQHVSSPPAWTLVMRPQFSLLLGVLFLEKPISVSAVPGYKVATDPPGLCFFLDPEDASRGAANPPPAALGGPGPDRDPGG